MMKLRKLSPDRHHGPIHGAIHDGITLSFDQRTRSRLRARTDDGHDAALDVERGGVLRDGDLLGTDDGRVIRVSAALESVTAVYCRDPLLLTRLCYHLGNRHVALQINEGRVAYQVDHVLDDLVRHFGLTPTPEQAPFEPEAGAYGHHHGGDHDH